MPQEENEDERRLAIVRISFPLIFEMIREGWEPGGMLRCTKGIPQDAVYVGCFVDDLTQCASLIFQHESFPITPIGTAIECFGPIEHVITFLPEEAWPGMTGDEPMLSQGNSE